MTQTKSTFEQLAAHLRCSGDNVRLVGVDGLGGAGKTTFARQLSAAGGGWSVVHTDDLASHDDAFGWAPRLLTEVIEPMRAGRDARFRPYDWVARRPADDELTVAATDVVVIEGVGATRAALRDLLTLRVWVATPREVRRQRAVARDGEQLRGFWEWWVTEEDRYVATDDPAGSADLVVDGAPAQPTAAGEFVVLSARRAAARGALPG